MAERFQKSEGETKLLTFLSGCDTFVVLPTRYDGKSLIYAMLPPVFGFGVARWPVTRTRVAIHVACVMRCTIDIYLVR